MGKHKSKNGKTAIIDLLPAILTFIVFGVTLACGILIFDESAGIAVLYCAVGVILNYVCGVLVHEAGHIVAANRFGLKVVKVNLGIVTIDFENQKVVPFTFFGKNAGETHFLPTREVTAKQIRTVAAYGILFSLLFLVIGAAAGVILSVATSGAAAFCLFTAGQTANFYIIAANTLSSDKTADGNIAFSDDDYVEVVAACAETERVILLGEIPDEADVIKSDNQPIALYFHYLFTAEKKNREEAFEVLDMFCDNLCGDSFGSLCYLDELTDEEYSLIFPEVLFRACVKGCVTDEMKERAEEFFAESETDGIGKMRAHYAFRKFTGDEKWAGVLLASYEKRLEKEPPFVVSVENKLFTR